MAISTAIETDSGLVAPNAYLRVGDLQHSKLEGDHVIHFCIAFYANAAAAAAGQMPINPPQQFMNVPFDLGTTEEPSPNAYQQAYAHAKTVWPEAVDIL